MEEAKELMHEDFQHVDVSQKTDTTDYDEDTSLSTDNPPQTPTNVLTPTAKVLTPTAKVLASPPALLIPPHKYSANTVNVENDANDKQSVSNVYGSTFDAQALASTDEPPKPFIKLTKPLLYAVGAGLSALAIMGGLLFARGKVRRS